MGRRGRLLREAVVRGEVMPRALRILSEDDSVEPAAIPLIKTKCPDITNLTEIKTCKRIMGLMGLPKVPKSIIKDKMAIGMRQVIAKLERAGETKDFIIKFYWDISEFRELWSKIGCTEDDWRRMVIGVK